MLGVLMVLQRVGGGNTIYFMATSSGPAAGSISRCSSSLKEPLPSILIVAIALILALWWMWKKARASHWHILRNIFDYVSVNFAEFTMGSFIVLYGGYAVHSSLNLGIRYIIPILPFIYILSAGVWKKWVMRFDLSGMASTFDMATTMARSIAVAFIKYAVLIILIVWLFCEAFFAAPYFLSYFNELAAASRTAITMRQTPITTGGKTSLRLQAWVNANPRSGQDRRGLFRRRRSTILSWRERG